MFKQLKYFQSVVRLNSFSEAAEENFISQSAISQQVQSLERELGFQLLERKNRSFTLTPAGAYFYQKSLILTADYERICREASKIAKGDQANLRIGFLRSYTGDEFYRALEMFTDKHPDVTVTVSYGNHEELYNLLLIGKIDLAFNDQRRAFSDQYYNVVLTTLNLNIEIPSHSILTQMKKVSTQELKNMPCILVSSEQQQENEREYYRDIIGFQGDFLFADNLEEGRMMVIGRKGFLPVEETARFNSDQTLTVRVPLVRGDKPIPHNYCLFWKKENSGYYIEEFAEIIKAQFKNKNE